MYVGGVTGVREVTRCPMQGFDLLSRTEPDPSMLAFPVVVFREFSKEVNH